MTCWVAGPALRRGAAATKVREGRGTPFPPEIKNCARVSGRCGDSTVTPPRSMAIHRPHDSVNPVHRACTRCEAIINFGAADRVANALTARPQLRSLQKRMFTNTVHMAGCSRANIRPRVSRLSR